jgi:hypothetical protein
VTACGARRLRAVDTTDLILSLIGRAESVALGMQELVDACAIEKPHEDWARVGVLDWQADADRVARWFGALVEANPPGPAGAADLYFGLHNPIGTDCAPTAAMYVIGYSRAKNWPGKKVWAPAGCRAHSSLFDAVYAIAYRRKRGLGNDLEYPILLGYAALLVREVGRRFVAPLIGMELRTGFDSGDIVKIGAVFEDGLELDAGWS